MDADVSMNMSTNMHTEMYADMSLDILRNIFLGICNECVVSRSAVHEIQLVADRSPADSGFHEATKTTCGPSSRSNKGFKRGAKRSMHAPIHGRFAFVTMTQ